MKKKSFKRYLFMLPAILMMVVIFFFSSRNAKKSTDESMLIAYYIVDVSNNFGLVEYSSPEEREVLASVMDDVIRKVAHMTEFAMLAFTVWFALIFWLDSAKRLYLLTFLISFIYACSDEIHQLFVEGRSGQIRDVFVDSTGIILSMLFVRFVECSIRESMYFSKQLNASGSERLSHEGGQL